jgi:Ca2+-binding EF-hand superfamily protein
MSHWRSKSSNKKSDNKHISKTIKSDDSTSLVLPDTIISTDMSMENWKSSKQISTARQIRKFLCFGSEKENAQQILDREFQSLDIDADGYVSIADLQSVLK